MSVTQANNGALWLITKSGKTGDSTVKIDAEEVLTREKAAHFLKAEAKNESTARRAWQTILAEIMMQDKVGTWLGKGDPKLSTLTKDFKSSLRDAESAYVRALFSDGILKARSKESEESEIQAMIGRLREDKNYSNIKNLVSRYFFCLGKRCKVDSFLIPAPVMMAELSDAKEKPSADTSVAGQLRDILKLIKNDDGSVDMKQDEVAASLPVALDIVKQLTAYKDYYSALETTKATHLPPNVTDMQPKVIGAPRRAPAPEMAEKKTTTV